MRSHVLAILAAMPFLGFGAGAQSSALENRAAMNYMLHCQGCHLADGAGRPGYVPALRGSISRFLAIPEGRAYLGRVPGTSQSMLSDGDRAAVLNWIVGEFDRQHLPSAFVPYTAEEMAGYRRNPESQAGGERARLLTLIASASDPSSLPSHTETTAATTKAGAAAKNPPPQFAICAACHSISADGASAMGPNLRGVVGRRAGTLSGFGYSSAMRASQIIWTRAELDSYLSNVATKVPGTMMAFGGVPDRADRIAIIDYLEQLK